jgi:hypothetical protein
VVLDLRRARFLVSAPRSSCSRPTAGCERAGRRLLVVGAPAELQLYLALTGLDRELTLVDSRPAGTLPA